MGDCPVCCEAFTDVKRLAVTCAYCQYDACAACYKQYMVSTMQDAHCMSCRQVWSRDVLSSYFSTSWLNGEYKKHRQSVLIEREKQLLPDSQVMVANYREAKRLRGGLTDKKLQLQHLQRRANELTRDIYNDRYRAERLEVNGYEGFPPTGGGESSKRQKVQFTAPCPVESCRGFLNHIMVCGTCEATACTTCGVLLQKDVTHACDANDVESFKAIKKDTKPCPKCAVPTYKISGCSQMWCVSCQTPWDWATNEIVEGVIHNPHYFQYLRERSATGEIPRQPGDTNRQPANCNRLQFPQGWDMQRRVRRDLDTVAGTTRPTDADMDKEPYKTARFKGEVIISMLRKLIHVSEVELRRLRNRYRNTDNADLRLKYLINEIGDDDLKVNLQRREKRRDKDLAVRDIYQMTCDTGRDLMWAYVDQLSPMEDTLRELEALRKYANDNLRKVFENFKMRVEFI